MDTTAYLLNNSVRSPVVDESEDEIFFGQLSEKETTSKNDKYTRRRTMPHWDRSQESFLEESFQKLEIQDKDGWSIIESPESKDERPKNVETEWSLNPRELTSLPNDYDAEDENDKSTLDVYNDQMFDDTIFTDYSQADLSAMAEKITKKWIKKKKTNDIIQADKENIILDIEQEEQEHVILDDERVILDQEQGILDDEKAILEKVDSLNSFPDKDSPFESWFTEEKEIMVLFEFFGEFYDEEFMKLNYEEKKCIKLKVTDTEPKTEEELLAMYPDTESSFNSTYHSPVKNPYPPVENLRFSDWFSEDEELILYDLIGLDYQDIFDVMDYDEKCRLKDRVQNTVPKTPEEILLMLEQKEKECNIISPKADKRKSRISTIASDFIRNPPSPKPRTLRPKPVPSPRRFFNTPRIKTPNYLKPTEAFTQRVLQSPKSPTPSLERLKFNLSPCNTPLCSKSPAKKLPLPSNINLDKIISPVARYIHNNPAPPITRVIKPCKLDREEFEEEVKKGYGYFPPIVETSTEYSAIPEATYKSSRVARQQRVKPDFSEPELPKIFDNLTNKSVEAKVVRHVGRVKVPKNQLYDDDVIEASPDSNAMGRPTFRRMKNIRDSVMPSNSGETMMEMSLHEIKAVQKLTHLRRK